MKGFTSFMEDAFMTAHDMSRELLDRRRPSMNDRKNFDIKFHGWARPSADLLMNAV